jgi:hypothetical protein
LPQSETFDNGLRSRSFISQNDFTVNYLCEAEVIYSKLNDERKSMRRLAICLALSAAVLYAAGAPKNKTAYVAVKNAELRTSASFFAGKKGALAYGEAVTIAKEDGKWTLVKSSSNAALSGWLSSANLTSKRILPASGSSASAQELALAGKGFNKEVEDSYKQRQSDLNYKDLDAVESISVPNNRLLVFINEGRLSKGAKQ